MNTQYTEYQFFMFYSKISSEPLWLLHFLKEKKNRNLLIGGLNPL